MCATNNDKNANRGSALRGAKQLCACCLAYVRADVIQGHSLSGVAQKLPNLRGEAKDTDAKFTTSPHLADRRLAMRNDEHRPGGYHSVYGLRNEPL